MSAKPRCGWRSLNDSRCRRTAVVESTIFEDHELRIDGAPGWFWVALCALHAEHRRDKKPIPKPRRKR